MSLARLHAGIDVPEYATHIPWLITRQELYRLVPAEAFTLSPAGWPLLRFTLLGITEVFGFNFVTHPESKLLGVIFDKPVQETVEAEFFSTSAVLRRHLGDPNDHDSPEFHHVIWRDNHVWVDHSAHVPENPASTRMHTLNVWYHAGMPRAWVSSKDRTLTEVKRLLNLMPDVEVIEVGRSPAYTIFGLTVSSQQSLSRLAYMACCANVRLEVGFNWYQEANGRLKRGDPDSIVYRIDIPGPREAQPGEDATTLQIVGIELTHDLRELGLLDYSEAERLIMALNNHEALPDE